MNEALLVGNITADPEVRTLAGGGKVVNFTVATNERWTDRATGEKKERAEFHRVVIFNEGLAKVAEDYLRKGSKILVRGQLQTRKWADKDGNDRYTTEIVLQKYRGELQMLDGKHDGEAKGGNTGGGYSEQSGGNVADYLDDDLPF